MEQGIECCKINWQTTNMKGMKNFNNALKVFYDRFSSGHQGAMQSRKLL